MLKIIKNSILFFSVSLACLLTIFTINNAKMSILAFDSGQYFDQVSNSNNDKREKVLSYTHYLISKDVNQKFKTQIPLKQAIERFFDYIFQDLFAIQDWDPSDEKFSKLANFDSDKYLPDNYYDVILPAEIQLYFFTPLLKSIDEQVPSTYLDQVTKFLSTEYLTSKMSQAIEDLKVQKSSK
ncbi:hypothetical protein [Candidatus Phytoplasma bonamiae]|uniref:Effector n=1 Tax=Candidatus Phytoplasma bonamiae TaxID=2982626 RepID=A0ABT9D5M4_9MOLU|nr:hypothetical protein ['Bonamia sp.' little leaf phytoplasma]MDO8064242.1 hypothetical protein ['Bonamia sp.' little leaf phytoplasma]MDV3174801.1 hypothetical protein ['Bonamia sp.' little leaf phytoplasma]